MKTISEFITIPFPKLAMMCTEEAEETKRLGRNPVLYQYRSKLRRSKNVDMTETIINQDYDGMTPKRNHHYSPTSSYHGDSMMVSILERIDEYQRMERAAKEIQRFFRDYYPKYVADKYDESEVSPVWGDDEDSDIGVSYSTDSGVSDPKPTEAVIGMIDTKPKVTPSEYDKGENPENLFVGRHVLFPSTGSEQGETKPSMVVRIKRLCDRAILPKAASIGLAGLKLCASQDETVIPKNGKAVVKTDLMIACPPGTYARITSTNSMATEKGVIVGAGVVDADYRGPVGVVLINQGHEDVVIHHGEHIAHLIFEKIVLGQVVECDELPPLGT